MLIPLNPGMSPTFMISMLIWVYMQNYSFIRLLALEIWKMQISFIHPENRPRRLLRQLIMWPDRALIEMAPLCEFYYFPWTNIPFKSTKRVFAYQKKSIMPTNISYISTKMTLQDQNMQSIAAERGGRSTILSFVATGQHLMANF